METRCFSFLRDSNTLGTNNSGSVCIQTLNAWDFIQYIHCMENRLVQYNNKCIPASLGQVIRFRISSIQLDKSDSKEDPRRMDISSNHCDTQMATSALVSTASKMSVQTPFLYPQVKDLSANPHW